MSPKYILASLLDLLAKAGIDARPIVLAAGEGSKSFASLESLSGALLDMEIDSQRPDCGAGRRRDRRSHGFAAGVLKRGVAFAQVPTTLLAQVDSSVGGKTGINTRQGKNLVGVFHQPRMVIADTALLATLPRREMLAGYAEVVKYGALGDADFFDLAGAERAFGAWRR